MARTSLVLAGVCLAVMVYDVASTSTVELSLVDRLFVPTADNSFVINRETVKKSVFHHFHGNYFIFSVGLSELRMIDANDPANLNVVFIEDVTDSFLSDVIAFESYVVVTAHNKRNRRKGKVLIYQIDGSELKFVHHVTVGADPESLVITKNGKAIIVANAGKQTVFDDPKGTIAILWFIHGMNGKIKKTVLDFDFKNDHAKTLLADGARLPGLERGATVAQDLEPKTVILNDKQTIAYVTLQVNNAYAVIDLKKKKIKHVIGLGCIDWSKKACVDPSDKDDGINLRRHPFCGLYQPDGLAYTKHHGKGILFFANEGAYRHPALISRGQALVNRLSSKASKRLKKQLSNDAQLGRTFFSLIDGKHKSGKFNEVFGFGGRGFSIRDAHSGKLLRHSGDKIERTIAEAHPDVFNAKINIPQIVKNSVDLASPEMGPETDSIVLGEIKDKQLIFVGSEVPGSIHVMSWINNPTKPMFESLTIDIERTDVTWQKLYDDRATGDLRLKVNQFIPGSYNPTGKPLLLVTGSSSSTVTLYEVVHTDIA